MAGAGATFGMPEVAVGIPSVIHAALIPAMIGASRAAWLLLTGEAIDAGTAASWGLVHDVVAEDELDARIAQLATRMAAFGPEAVRQQKRLLNQWTDMTPAQAIEASVAQFGRAFLTGEPQHYMGRLPNGRLPSVAGLAEARDEPALPGIPAAPAVVAPDGPTAAAARGRPRSPGSSHARQRSHFPLGTATRAGRAP